MNRKVTVVGGAGNVGATVVRSIANRELADVVSIDIADQKAAGVALDIAQACPVEGSDARVVGGGDYALSAGSDIVVITSGVPRKPGMSRDDLLNVNYKIMQDVTANVVKHSPNCIIIVVANPLDAMAQAVYKLSGFPRERVIGMAGVLDSARMRTFIAMELNVSVDNIHAFVLGATATRWCRCRATRPWRASRLRSCCRPTGSRRSASARPTAVPRSRSSWDERVVRAGPLRRGDGRGDPEDTKKILPCSVYLQGEYGVKDQFLGVPVKLGATGVEQVVEITLTDEERAALMKSAGAVKELVTVIGV